MSSRCRRFCGRCCGFEIVVGFVGLLWMGTLAGCAIGPVRFLSWEPAVPANPPATSENPQVQPPAAATSASAGEEPAEWAHLGPAERAALRAGGQLESPAATPPGQPKSPAEPQPFPDGPYTQVALDNSAFQPPYLGRAWLGSVDLQLQDRGDRLDLTWINEAGMTLQFSLTNPFRVQVRAVSGAWETECTAAWRAGYDGFLLMGPADANRACLPAPDPSHWTKIRLGVNVCKVQAVEEVEVTVPGTPVKGRGQAYVLVGKD